MRAVMMVLSLGACGSVNAQDPDAGNDASPPDASSDASQCGQLPSSIGAPVLGYWPFEDNLNDPLDNARSFAPADGAPTFVDGRRCRAVRLDASRLTHTADQMRFDFEQTPFAVSLWANFDEAPADPRIPTLFSKTSDSNASADGFSLFRHAEGSIRFCYDTGTGGSGCAQTPGSVAISTSRIQPFTWVHIAVVRRPPPGISNGTVELWINGVLEDGRGLDQLSLTNSNQPLQVGRAGTDPVTALRASVDEVIVYGGELSAADIALLATP